MFWIIKVLSRFITYISKNIIHLMGTCLSIKEKQHFKKCLQNKEYSLLILQQSIVTL